MRALSLVDNSKACFSVLALGASIDDILTVEGEGIDSSVFFGYKSEILEGLLFGVASYKAERSIF